LDEAVVQWGVAVEQSVVDRPVQEVEGDFEVGAGGDLAAVDCPKEQGPGRVAPGPDEMFAIQGGEHWVRLGLGPRSASSNPSKRSPLWSGSRSSAWPPSIERELGLAASTV
jgi:hypothetical protein